MAIKAPTKKPAAKTAPALKTVAAKAPVKKAVAPKKAPAKKAAAPKKAAPKAAAPASKGVKVTAPAGKAITQSALLQMIADHNEISRAEAKRFVEGYIEVVKAHVLKGVKVKIGDLGMIMIRSRKARMGRNPQTGAPVKIKASKKLAFRQSATMRDSVR